MYTFSYWFLVFFIFSILGYFSEIIYCYIMDGKIVNRGFLYGPYCPIYGVGAVFILFLLKDYLRDPIVLFVFSMIICSAIEYIASYIMEKLFNNKWWDYSNKKYNINGRVCLFNSVLFGLGGLVSVYFLFPLINRFLKLINNTLLEYLAVIFLILFIIDLIITISQINKFNKQLAIINKIKNDMKIKIPAIVQSKINKSLKKYKTYPKRIIKAFPNIKLKQDSNIKLLINAIKENRKKK